ncbi:MAG: hypothetical protein WCH85_10345 [Methanomicrobiales archaeon]
MVKPGADPVIDQLFFDDSCQGRTIVIHDVAFVVRKNGDFLVETR